MSIDLLDIWRNISYYQPTWRRSGSIGASQPKTRSSSSEHKNAG